MFATCILVAVVLALLLNSSITMAEESNLPTITIENAYLDENLKIQSGWDFEVSRENYYENYYITVKVHKPDGIQLSAGKWKVGVYFWKYYGPQGDSCFNKGTWEEIELGVWFYTGWREAQVDNISWENLEAGEMELTIPIHIVGYPRPDEDIQHGMVDASGPFKVVAYLEIDNVNHNIDNENQVTFEIGDNTFVIPFVRLEAWENFENKMNVHPWRGEQLWFTQYSAFIDVSTDALVIRTMRDALCSVMIYEPHFRQNLLPLIILIVFVGAFIAVAIIFEKRKPRTRHG